jgi:hypothetical protein
MYFWVMGKMDCTETEREGGGKKGTDKTVSLTLSRRRENREKVENGFSPASPNPKCSNACKKQQPLAPSTKYAILLTRTEASLRPLSFSLSLALENRTQEKQWSFCSAMAVEDLSFFPTLCKDQAALGPKVPSHHASLNRRSFLGFHR